MKSHIKIIEEKNFPVSTTGTTTAITPAVTYITNTNTSAPSITSSLSTPSHNNSEPPHVVIQHLHSSVPYMVGQQPLHLEHCVQKVYTSSFYGNFSIYDRSGRLLAKSKDNKVSFLKEDLQTECARVWYDAFCIHPEYEVLRNTYRVKDPGLCFGFGDVLIEFDDAPCLSTNQVYKHIPVFFNVTNVWVPLKKETLFKTL